MNQVDSCSEMISSDSDISDSELVCMGHQTSLVEASAVISKADLEQLQQVMNTVRAEIQAQVAPRQVGHFGTNKEEKPRALAAKFDELYVVTSEKDVANTEDKERLAIHSDSYYCDYYIMLVLKLHAMIIACES